MRSNDAVGRVAKPRLVAELDGYSAAERAEQRVEKPEVELAGRRKLKENRAEAGAQRSQAFGKDAGEPDLVEGLGGVRQATIGLHAKAKARRRFGCPLRQRGLGWRAIEATVQLNPVQPFRIEGEHLGAR